MRNSFNATRAAVLSIGLTLGALTGVSAPAIATEHVKDPRDAAYLEHVIAILRAHVLSMRAIIDESDMKYADNMVRHAEAFERAFGTVGPMDWHAAKAFQKTQKAGAPNRLTEDEFDDLAEASYRKVLGIKRAAKRYMRDKDGERMGTAIDSMIKSCGACHSKLPKGTVPSVWKGLKPQ